MCKRIDDGYSVFKLCEVLSFFSLEGHYKNSYGICKIHGEVHGKIDWEHLQVFKPISDNEGNQSHFLMNLLARVTQTCPGKLTQRGEGHLQTHGGQQGHPLCQLEQKYNSLSMIWGQERIMTYWKLC